MTRLLAILVVMAVMVPLGAQTLKPGPSVICRYWRDDKLVNHDIRAGILIAYGSVWINLMNANSELPAIPTTTTIDENVEGVSAICRKPENATMHVAAAFGLWALKVAGATDAQVDAKAAEWRRTWAMTVVDGRKP
jgi:hypothetical protein